MPLDTQTANQPLSVARLLSGIVADVQSLVEQQLRLFRREVESDLRKTRHALIPMFLGIGVCLVGLGVLAVMPVYLLHWALAWPLWVCFGVVGAAFLLLGAGLFFAGKKSLASFSPLPDESAQALKENIQCLMNPR